MQMSSHYLLDDPRILKFEQGGLIIKQCIQKMLKEWQTVSDLDQTAPIWSGSAQFAHVYLSQNLGFLG